jgi:transcriptional regulator with XRE-family HTH domain
VPWVIGRDGKTYSVSDDAHLWRLAYGLSLLSMRKSPEEVADVMGVSVRTVRRWRKRFAPVIEEAQRKADAHGGRGPRNWDPPISPAMVRRALTVRPKP